MKLITDPVSRSPVNSSIASNSGEERNEKSRPRMTGEAMPAPDRRALTTSIPSYIYIIDFYHGKMGFFNEMIRSVR